MFKRHFLAYFALSAVAVAQPIIDLYGRNLTVFSAAKMGSLEILVFVGLLIVGPPAVLLGIESLCARFGERVQNVAHRVLLWPLLYAVALLVCSSLDFERDVLVYPVSAAVASVALWCLVRYSIVRTWVSWLSLVAVISGATFVVQAWPLLAKASPDIAKTTIGNPDTPVLMIILDELPLYALVDDSGAINADRFPGFARLQQHGTWYPDTVAAANFTHQAVPAILASEDSHRDSSPVLGEYPHNLFTALGGVTSIDATEPVTSLCPTEICASATSSRTGLDLGRIGSFFVDAAVVWGLRALPAATRDELPSTAYGWDGWVNVAKKFLDSGGVLAQLDNIIDGANRLTGADAPQVSVVHALTPHGPWYMTPTRQVAYNMPSGGQNSQYLSESRYNYQRLLYQLAATDAALVDAFDVLDRAGSWDETMVVVTADHGISFIPQRPQRNSQLVFPEHVSDIYRIPLLIKYPRQATGVVADCPASNIDVVPTILDVLDVDLDWDFAGGSLADGRCPERDGRRIQSAQGPTATITDGFESTLGRVVFYSSLVPASGDARRIAYVGQSANLVGTTIDLDALPRHPAPVLWTVEGQETLSNVSLAPGARSPAILVGGVMTEEPLGEEGIVTINGVAAGVVGFDNRSGVIGFGVVLDYGLFTTPGASYRIELVLRDSTGRLTRVGPPAADR